MTRVAKAVRTVIILHNLHENVLYLLSLSILIGCIDFTDTSNNGLANIVSLLDPVYQQYQSIISKADLWVLAANLAIQFASTAPSSGAYRKLYLLLFLFFTYLPKYVTFDAYTCTAASAYVTPALPATSPLILPFRYGRIDALSCKDAGMLPSNAFAWADINNYFGGRFGMTVNEVIAIMVRVLPRLVIYALESYLTYANIPILNIGSTCTW